MEVSVNEPLLEERFSALEAARAWSPRVVSRLDGDEIYLTRDVHDAPGVAALLSPFAVARGHAQLKGVGGEMEVFRVGGKPAVAAAS